MADEEYLDQIKEQLSLGRNQWRRGDNLLAAFGYIRRRQSAIDVIKEALAARGMTTDPELTTDMPLDRAIRFHLLGEPEPDETVQPAYGPETPVEEIRIAQPNEAAENDKTGLIPREPPINPKMFTVGKIACA
jgi:hypothetical protein